MNLTVSEKLVALQANYEALSQNVDVFFLVINSIVIYLMQGGFAFLECGSVRAKNATNILIKNLMDSFIGAVCYWLVGWALAFGGSGNPFCGATEWAHFMMSGDKLSLWFFHFVFAATAATIVSGAVAERCDFKAYIIYSIFLTAFLYPVLTHWAWDSTGWLATGMEFQHNNQTLNTAFMDFAGSGIVHLFGGTAAFVAAALLGPRKGRFTHDDTSSVNSLDEKDAHSQEFRGHSIPLAALGGFILFFGFFAFNGGSQASISQPGDGVVVARAVVNTIISGSGGALTAVITNYIVIYVTGRKTYWSLLFTINGALSGMVAICAGANQMHAWAAFITGVVSGFAYMFWSWLVSKLKIDDPLDAVAVHGGAGWWGLMAAPIFAIDVGLCYNFGKASLMALAWNLIGSLAIIAWSGGCCLVMFGLLKCINCLRVDIVTEDKGLDIPKHGEPAYPVFAYGDGWMDKEQLIYMVPGSGPVGPPVLGPNMAKHDEATWTEANVVAKPSNGSSGGLSHRNNAYVNDDENTPM